MSSQCLTSICSGCWGGWEPRAMFSVMLTMVLRISGVLGVLGVWRELSPAELAGTLKCIFVDKGETSQPDFYLQWTIQTNLPGIVLPSAHRGNMWGLSEKGNFLTFFSIVETKEKIVYFRLWIERGLLSQCPFCKQARHQKWNNQFQSIHRNGTFLQFNYIFGHSKW